MSKPKFTEWFDPEIKPVHVGWYSVEYYFPFKDPKFKARKHWNGKFWSMPVWSDEDGKADRFAKPERGDQSGFKWRGLTAPHPKYKGSK